MNTTSLIKEAMNHTDGLKKRRMELTGNFLYLASLIGGHHPNGGWEIDFMSKFNYKEYLKDWDTFFDLIQKEHLEKRWYNPFISRHTYNFVRILPVKVISNYIFNTIIAHRLASNKLEHSDELDIILNIDWLNLPVVFFEHQLEQLEQIATAVTSQRYQKFMVFARSGQKFISVIREAEEHLVRSWQNVNKRYKDLYKEHASTAIQMESMANMRYEITILDALMSLPYASSEYGSSYLQTLILEEKDKVNLNDILGEPLSGVERQIYILSTSTDPIELALTMKAFLDNRIIEQEAFVMTKGFKVLVDRFAFYTNLKPTDLLKPLRIEDSPELVEATRVDADGLAATIRRLEKEKGLLSKDIDGKTSGSKKGFLKDSASAPKHRWIRTLDGEFFVNEDKEKVKTPVIDPETGKPKLDPVTGEPIMEEKVKKVFNFIKTAVGNETETTLTETMSVYGKTLSPEERRYNPARDEETLVNKHAGEKGDVGSQGTSMDDLTDAAKLKRDQIGTAHLGHRTDDRQRERIEIVARRWAEEVIARWKHEIDDTQQSTVNTEEEKPLVKPTEEAGTQASPSGEKAEGKKEEVAPHSDTDAHLPNESVRTDGVSDLPSHPTTG